MEKDRDGVESEQTVGYGEIQPASEADAEKAGEQADAVDDKAEFDTHGYHTQ